MKLKKESLKHQLELPTLPFDIASSTDHDLIAVSNIDGEITLLRYNNTGANTSSGSGGGSDDDTIFTTLDTIQHHTDSCRRVIFSGTSLLSISSDKSLVQCDVTTKSVVRRFDNEHALYSLTEVRDGNIFATGDDEGTIKVWDLRKSDDAMIMKQPEHDNFISSMTVDSTGSTLLAASGDGRLSVWNSRQRKLIARSDECDSELLTCDIVHGGSKVVCGDGSGVLNIFSWDDWGDISDRSVVQEDVSIDVVMVYNTDTMILGCMDGVIRATSLFPHRPLPHIGDHGDNGIEGICASPDQSDILSIGHDCLVKCWSVEQLEEGMRRLGSEDSDEEEEGEGDSSEDEDEKPRKRKKLKHITSNQVKANQSADFFSDLA